MSIDPNTVYDFTFISYDYDADVAADDITWDLTGRGSLLAGLIVGLNILIDEIEQADHHIQQGRNNSIVLRLEDRMYDLMRHNFNIRGIEIILSNFIETSAVFDLIPSIMDVLPDGDTFYWWLPDFTDGGFILYKFDNADFIQGFISICNAFQVDFRDYILGPPFKIIDNTEIDYDIQGYDIEHIPHYRL